MYPNSWKYSTFIYGYTFTSPSGSTTITYTPTGNPGGGSPDPQIDHVISVTDTRSSNYKVIGLATRYTTFPSSYAINLFVYPAQSSSQYVPGAVLTEQLGGASYPFPNPINPSGPESEIKTTLNFNSLNAAEEWYNTTDAKTAIQIMSSVALDNSQ